jgi:predicted TIM-barrel fold metal-dependent hydrolase
MIDCHTHAFPAMSEQVDRFLDSLSADAGFILRDALEDVRGAMAPVARGAQRWARRLPPLLDIERVAKLESRLPLPVRRGLEAVVATGLLPQRALTGHLDALLASMDENGIERAVLIAAPPLATNAWLLHEAWPRARARLIPVATLPDVARDAPPSSWSDAFEALVKEGARGFKIHPGYDGLPADHAAYRALFETAQLHRRFVVVHTGRFEVPGIKRGGPTSPEELEPLFHEYASVPVCLAHMNREHPEAAWELMRRHEQLFADTSWQPEESVRTALKEVGARRILLGSDWPLLHGSLQADALGILKRAASEKDLERILQYTPLVFVGEA